MYRHDSVQEVPIAHIELDETNLDIHVPFDPQGHDEWLVENVRQRGILAPLTLTVNGKCTDGRRRLAAAKHAGLKTVPVLVAEGDAKEMHLSAQLHRQMSIFAQCVMFGSEIKAANEKGRDRSGNISSDDVERAWGQLEAVLGRNRKTLQRGVSLLDQLAEEPENDRQAALFNRVTTVFQQMGLRPALRLIGDMEEPQTESDHDEEEVDQSDWVTEEDDDFSGEPKRERKKPNREPDAINAPEGSSAWAKDVYRALARIHQALDQQGLLTTEVTESLDHLEAVVADSEAGDAS